MPASFHPEGSVVTLLICKAQALFLKYQSLTSPKSQRGIGEKCQYDPSNMTHQI